MTLKGDPGLCNSLISLKAMPKVINGEGEAILLELCSLLSTDQQPQESTVPNSIQLLLAEFLDLFAESHTLPSVHAQDHAIVLQPRSGPVNVCPYRYRQHQKSKIVTLVNDM